MSQIGDLRSALRENLKAIPGVQVSRFALVNPTPPGFHLWPSEIPRYRKTFGTLALAEVHFTVQAFVSFGSNEGTQETMDEFLGADGARSVAQAIEADRTLGGNAEDLECQSSQGYGWLVRTTGDPLLTADWLVTVVL